MIKFICFGSGSSGNCYYINADGYGLLIDEGIGIRKFKKYFRDYGLSFGDIKGILVTHDHADHVRAVGAVSIEFHLPVYALADVYMGMNRNRFVRKKVPAPLANTIVAGETFDLGPFEITPFQVPHDSADNCGYFISVNNTTFCLMTDVGHVTETMRHHLSNAKYIVVESNYDAYMLENGRYPRHLKDRIRNGTGHVDNADTAKLLSECLSADARHIWLCHLSEENNRPDLALQTVSEALKQAGRLSEDDPLTLEALQRTHPSKLYELK